MKRVMRREPGDTQPPLTTCYYFFFAFFAAFFFAFFFAAIIVSFKVNLGMLHVRMDFYHSHSHRTIFRTLRVASLPSFSRKKFRKNRAWCGKSISPLKKKATPLSTAFDGGISDCVFDATSNGVRSERVSGRDQLGSLRSRANKSLTSSRVRMT